MPRYSAEHVPSYRLHKKSGDGVVTIAGKDYYLGKYKTPESQQAYNRLISKWFAAGRNPTVLNVTRQQTVTPPDPISVEEVMRSGELVIMRTGDIDRRGPVWVYTPSRHKTQHHGHTRTIYLSKSAQDLLTPFLKLDAAAYLFSPAEATVERLEAATAKRKTPKSCGNTAGKHRKAQAKRLPGERYRDTSYAKAVARACDRAVPTPDSVTVDAIAAWRKARRFHPHQLRHAAATRFRRDYNLETARALLGQKSMDAAEIYAEMDMEKARNVMRDVG